MYGWKVEANSQREEARQHGCGETKRGRRKRNEGKERRTQGFYLYTMTAPRMMGNSFGYVATETLDTCAKGRELAILDDYAPSKYTLATTPLFPACGTDSNICEAETSGKYL